MHQSTPAFLSAFLMLSFGGGCDGGGKDTQKPQAEKTDFPEGYTSWPKVNVEPIVREDEKVARDIYKSPKGDLEVGTVLVKEQYILTDAGQKGPLANIAVMRRGQSTTNQGWIFEVYSPEKKRFEEDTTGCAGCHALREGQDFLFTPRDQLK
jgi:hypothetical protein